MKKSFVIGLMVIGVTAPAALAQPADIVTIGSGTQSGYQITVPIFIRDTSGTPLGIDQPSGSRIQSYSIKVNYAPSASITSVTLTRAGITSPLTPTFESTPSSPGTISLLDTFNESTNLIPFTLNAAVPGNQVAKLVFTFASNTPDGTTVSLTLDPTLTQLSNQAGTTNETTTSANLLLVNSSITFQTAIAAAVPTLDWRILLLLAAVLGWIGMRVAR